MQDILYAELQSIQTRGRVRTAAGTGTDGSSPPAEEGTGDVSQAGTNRRRPQPYPDVGRIPASPTPSPGGTRLTPVGFKVTQV